MRATMFLVLVAAVSTSEAHRIPDVFVTGQRLIDQFDPAIKPKMLHSQDGTFVAKLPAEGWASDAERIRHIRSIDAENGRWYIHAVFDEGRGKTFCFSEKERPDDETFYDDLIRELRALPAAQLQRHSASELLTNIWRRKWPCLRYQRRPK
jgi:hypothetical protein